MTAIKDLLIDINRHLLEDEKPSVYLNEISNVTLFNQHPFDMLQKLKKTEQSPKHHPEGNVWNHTMLVLDEAAKVKTRSKDQQVFMWAALLHDIGKPGTTQTRKGRITSYDHDKLGAQLAGEFLTEFTDDREFTEKVSQLIRWHMQILFVVNNLPFADIRSMKSKTDVSEVALLGLCDRLGRLGANRTDEESNIFKFLEKCML